MALLAGILGQYSSLSEEQMPPPPQWAARLVNILFKMRVRSFLQARGISNFHFTSGVRTVEHNREVGGAKNSAHLFGVAADVVLDAAPEDPLTQGPVSASGLAREWIKETGGYALDERTHLHLNAKRIDAWNIIRQVAFILVMVIVVVLVLFLSTLGRTQ